jgi:hypothetical protein
MKAVYDDPNIAMPLEYFTKPPGVYQDTICVETKLLATPYCPATTVEYFTEKMRPGLCQKHATSKWREGEEGLGRISFCEEERKGRSRRNARTMQRIPPRRSTAGR